MSEGHSYDIHEKIAQLETELLQHELLIRRQKHVITSLKNMINNPNTGGMASPSASITHAPAAIPAPVVARSVPVTASTSSSSSLPQHAAVVLSAPGAKQPSTSSSTKKATAPTAAAPVRSINHQKKRTAMNKVKQFCKTIPRFGAPVVKLKRSSSASEGGTEGTSKRQRVDSANVNTSIQIGFAVGSPAARSVANRAVVSAGSTAPGVPRIGAASSSHSTDDDALFDAAGAKLRYLKNTSSAASSMQPVGLMPVASSVAAWDASHAGTKATAQHTSSSSAASALSSSSSKTGSSASASSSSHKVIAGSSKSASAAPPPAAAGATQAQKQAEVARLHVQALRAAPPRNSSSVSDAITTESSTRVSTPPPKSSARTFTSTTAVTTSAAVAGRSSSNAATSSIASASTLTTSATPAAPISVGSPKSITTNKNLLTGSAHKNLDIFDHCKCVSSLEEKLEIAKDMHAYIICNPRRLQQFLDSTGGRDLFLSWLISAMNSVDSAPAGGPLEVQLTKLIEYTVLLINQAYWDARTVSELRFDKTLKNLYRQFEGKKAAHHVTVSNIVKGIWPSYRIMRKQHEGKTKASAVLIAD